MLLRERLMIGFAPKSNEMANGFGLKWLSGNTYFIAVGHMATDDVVLHPIKYYTPQQNSLVS